MSLVIEEISKLLTKVAINTESTRVNYREQSIYERSSRNILTNDAKLHRRRINASKTDPSSIRIKFPSHAFDAGRNDQWMVREWDTMLKRHTPITKVKRVNRKR